MVHRSQTGNSPLSGHCKERLHQYKAVFQTEEGNLFQVSQSSSKLHCAADRYILEKHFLEKVNIFLRPSKRISSLVFCLRLYWHAPTILLGRENSQVGTRTRYQLPAQSERVPIHFHRCNTLGQPIKMLQRRWFLHQHAEDEKKPPKTEEAASQDKVQ